MGNVGPGQTSNPEAIERHLPWGPVIRGLRWGGGPDVALLLHEPGADVDAWDTLPEYLARTLSLEVTAVDLPGHGLSDDPWEAERLPDLLRALLDITGGAGRRYLIAAGAAALASPERAAEFELSGLVCLSPDAPPEGWNPPRSPTVPKLFVAGSMAGSDLDTARRLAAACGGWAVVTSLPVAERGTGLFASPWGGRLIEEIVAFLRDCQRRPTRASVFAARPRPNP